MSYNKPLICPKHGIERTYYKDSARPSGKALVCTECAHERHVNYYKTMTPEHKRELNNRRNARRDSEYHRSQNLRHSYGMTHAEYVLMLDSQSGVCAICGKPETAKNQYGTKHLAVDHDHTTGRVRGLLCSSCNQMIGKAGDSPSVLEAAAQYLRSRP